MIWFCLLIPLFVTIGFYLFKKPKFVWWEFFIPIILSIIVIFISKAVIEKVSVTFTEYWGSQIISIYEEEPYNEWVSRTCSESYACGTDSKGNTTYCTRYYDCSYQDDIGPKWYAKTNIGEVIDISEKEYDKLFKQFGTGKKSVKSIRNHDAYDRCVNSNGTKFQGKCVGEYSYVYETKWDGDQKKAKSYVSSHNYENRIKASDVSVFNISLVSDTKADSLGLFKYPELKNGLTYPTILGKNIPDNVQEKFRNLNGKFGNFKQVRLWILIFDNKPKDIANYQENYWVKGNKNELVVCIGRNGDKITWSHAFSWALSEELTIEAKNKVLELYEYKEQTVNVENKVPLPSKLLMNKHLGKLPVMPLEVYHKDSIIKVKSPTPVLTQQTYDELYSWFENNLHKFKRRNFEEFSYLTIEPSLKATIITAIITLIISVLSCVWVVNNEFDDNTKRKYRY